MKQLLTAVVAWMVSLFSGEPIVIGFDRNTGRYRAFSRGRLFSVRAIMGAAFTVLEVDFPAAAAGAESAQELGVVPENESQQAWQLLKIALLSPVLVTGATATALTFTFNQKRAGAQIAALGSFVTVTGVTGNLPADTEVNVPITGAPALLAGDIIEVLPTHAGAGTAIPAGLVARVELG